MNADPQVTGFLVQQPTGLDEYGLLSRVNPDKDTDAALMADLGLRPMTMGEPRQRVDLSEADVMGMA